MIQLAETVTASGSNQQSRSFDELLRVLEFERRHQSRRNLRGNAGGPHIAMATANPAKR
jgi:hypothetical protein